MTMYAEALRLSIVMGNHSPSLHRLIRMRVDEEEQEARLHAIAGPLHIEELLTIAESRVDDFHRRAVEMAPSPGMTPRAAALRSVIDDVSSGRLGSESV